MPKPRKRFRLTRQIIIRSVASTWSEARQEWELVNIVFADRDEPASCLCGKMPIIEVCILRNKCNQKQVSVGNCCVLRFLDLEAHKVFQGLKRVRANPEKAFNAATVDLCMRKGCISSWEERFYLDTMRKRKLSPKQREKRAEINVLILDCLGRR